MNIIFSSLIVILIILLFTIFAAWLDKFGRKHKEEFIEKAINRVSSIVSTHLTTACDLYKTGPWYLVVYTKDSNYPVWISNNNVRSVHPAPNNRKIIIKLFQGEDMVIDNVENYELCPANEMCDYDM